MIAYLRLSMCLISGLAVALLPFEVGEICFRSLVKSSKTTVLSLTSGMMDTLEYLRYGRDMHMIPDKGTLITPIYPGS